MADSVSWDVHAGGRGDFLGIMEIGQGEGCSVKIPGETFMEWLLKLERCKGRWK